MYRYLFRNKLEIVLYMLLAPVSALCTLAVSAGMAMAIDYATKQVDMKRRQPLSKKGNMPHQSTIDGFWESISLVNRVIFIRRYWFCDTYAEIASRYGMRERKVKRIILDTREEMCAYMEKSWGTFGISQIDSKFVREAEDDYILREGSKVIIGYRSMLNDIFQIFFERFLSFPKRA